MDKAHACGRSCVRSSGRRELGTPAAKNAEEKKANQALPLPTCRFRPSDPSLTEQHDLDPLRERHVAEQGQGEQRPVERRQACEAERACEGRQGFWWVFPLLGLVVMGAMLFACVRGFGCMGGRAARAPGDVTELRRELQALKEDVSKLVRNPS